MDECGFSPSQPVSYSWVLPGQRKRIPYENPQGRRLNVLAALIRHGPTPSLGWVMETHGAFVAEQLLDFLPQLPRPAGQPLVVVLDNASYHVNQIIKAGRAKLREQRIYLYYLPPYSPELNLIEPVFGVIKGTGLPERSYTTMAALEAAADQAFMDYEAQLQAKTAPHPRLAA
ncbi:MAG: IS630 family transposase [Dehalococcoidia bacterium]